MLFPTSIMNASAATDTTSWEHVQGVLGMLGYTIAVVSVIIAVYLSMKYKAVRGLTWVVSMALLASTYYDTSTVAILVKWVIVTELYGMIDGIVTEKHHEELEEVGDTLRMLVKRDAELREDLAEAMLVIQVLLRRNSKRVKRDDDDEEEYGAVSTV